jgi:hypothetical protein
MDWKVYFWVVVAGAVVFALLEGFDRLALLIRKNNGYLFRRSSELNEPRCHSANDAEHGR